MERTIGLTRDSLSFYCNSSKELREDTTSELKTSQSFFRKQTSRAVSGGKCAQRGGFWGRLMPGCLLLQYVFNLNMQGILWIHHVGKSANSVPPLISPSPPCLFFFLLRHGFKVSPHLEARSCLKKLAIRGLAYKGLLAPQRLSFHSLLVLHDVSSSLHHVSPPSCSGLVHCPDDKTVKPPQCSQREQRERSFKKPQSCLKVQKIP